MKVAGKHKTAKKVGRRKKKPKRNPEDKFLTEWNLSGLEGGTPQRQFKICGKRFDFAWPLVKVAVEIDGFGYGHQKIGELIRNADKRNAAIESGWTVLVYTTAHVSSQRKLEEAVRQVVNVILTRPRNKAKKKHRSLYDVTV